MIRRTQSVHARHPGGHELGEAQLVAGLGQAARRQFAVDPPGEDREQDGDEGGVGVRGGPPFRSSPAHLGGARGDQEDMVDGVAGLLQLVRGLEGDPGSEQIPHSV
ncbi:hypothetical protein SMICM17S_04045 [Streptomyces microflavus]